MYRQLSTHLDRAVCIGRLGRPNSNTPLKHMAGAPSDRCCNFKGSPSKSGSKTTHIRRETRVGRQGLGALAAHAAFGDSAIGNPFRVAKNARARRPNAHTRPRWSCHLSITFGRAAVVRAC